MHLCYNENKFQYQPPGETEMKAKVNFFRGILSITVVVAVATLFGVVTSTCGGDRKPTLQSGARASPP